MAKPPNIAKRRLSALELQTEREHAKERIRFYAGKSKAQNTKRAYKGDTDRFRAWCVARSEVHFPAAPAVVSWYLTHLADLGRRPSTIMRACAAIAKMHEAGGQVSPTKDPIVKATLAGICREKGIKQDGKDPVLTKDLAAMVEVWNKKRLLHYRNRFLLVFVWWTALRRSEASAVDFEHLTRVSKERLRLLIPFSKTDQAGEGQYVGLVRRADPKLCPVAGFEKWSEQSGLDSGPLFPSLHGPRASGRLSPQGFNHVLKTSAAKAGLPVERLGAHSLRAGFVTQAYMDGMREFDIRQVTRHKTEDMTRRYIRPLSIFEHGAGEKIK